MPAEGTDETYRTCMTLRRTGTDKRSHFVWKFPLDIGSAPGSFSDVVSLISDVKRDETVKEDDIPDECMKRLHARRTGDGSSLPDWVDDAEWCLCRNALNFLEQWKVALDEQQLSHNRAASLMYLERFAIQAERIGEQHLDHFIWAFCRVQTPDLASLKLLPRLSDHSFDQVLKSVGKYLRIRNQGSDGACQPV